MQEAKGKSRSKRTLSRADWIDAARLELIAKGISAVKVGRLARRLKVTRGGFYWHFKNHQELLEELLKQWEVSNTRPFEEALEGENRRRGYKEFLNIVSLFINEDAYDPAFDTAVRDWARTSRAAGAAIRRVDDKRIDILHLVFQDLGYQEPEAFVRARITYFHQVGYYAMNVKEDPEARRALVPVYVRVLSGKPLELSELSAPVEPAMAG